MANVKDRYTELTRQARNARASEQAPRGSNAHHRDADIAEEKRLADTFRRRAREDFRPLAPTTPRS
jgi:hypothetical protein